MLVTHFQGTSTADSTQQPCHPSSSPYPGPFDPAHAHLPHLYTIEWCSWLCSSMQTLQVLEFTVLDNCSSKLNQLLTLLSYIHVAFQPLVFNEFVWGQPQAAFNRPIITPYADSVMHKSIRRLSIAGAGLMLAKAAPAFLRFFGLGQRELGSTLGTAAAKMLTGPSTWCDRGPGESMCGRQLCTFKGKAHIGWVLPMIPHR